MSTIQHVYVHKSGETTVCQGIKVPSAKAGGLKINRVLPEFNALVEAGILLHNSKAINPIVESEKAAKEKDTAPPAVNNTGDQGSGGESELKTEEELRALGFDELKEYADPITGRGAEEIITKLKEAGKVLA